MPDLMIDVKDFPAEGLELTLDIAPEKVVQLVTASGEEEPVVKSPLTGLLRIGLNDSRLAVRGNFKVTVSIPCDRCLAETSADITSQVDEILELGSANTDALEDEEVDGLLPIIDGRADLSGLMAELFWLAWPFRFICRTDCAGLCIHCGADLNDGPCGCGSSTH